MIKFLAAYGATAVTLVLLDVLWLGVIAKPAYQEGIGHLMAARPNLVAAALFYTLYPAGVVLFAVAPDGVSLGWQKTFMTAALFGFFAYATYDLTNLATLKDWPAGLAALDIAWGALITALAALAGKAALDRLSPTWL